jgi:predicted AAA+ superfamily ATPase
VKALIEREELLKRVKSSLDAYPVTLILGPRQCGKSTVARLVCEQNRGLFFDLEDPLCPLRPESAANVLAPLRGLVVLDEIQRQPQLFQLLRVLADRPDAPARFLILGSAAPELIQGAAESLAGRVSFVPMTGFNVEELGVEKADALWIRGAFPASCLAADDDRSMAWRSNFIQACLERDLPQLGIRVSAQTVHRFWMMLAHYHGQIWNAAELARAMSVKENTARHYLDILCGTFMVRQLPAWFENLGKRIVKSPRIYLRDSGLLHSLLGLGDRLSVLSYPRFGFSWEGFVIEQILSLLHTDRDSYFYRTHAGAELDLLTFSKGRRYGFEIKFEDRPQMTRSMHVVLSDLELEKLWVVRPSGPRYPLAERVEVVSVGDLPSLLPALRQ